MRIAAIFILALGCQRASTSTPTVQPDPVASAKPDALDGGEPPVDFGPSGPVVIAPAVPKFVTGMMDHATHFGWSADGKWFGHCATNGGRGDTRCQLVGRDGKHDVFDDWDEKKDEEDPKKRALLDKRIKELDLKATSNTWAFARDLELVWDTPSGDTMRVGARMRGEPPSFPIKLRVTDSFAKEGSFHPEAIAVSPDGTTLGAMGHHFMGEFSDRMIVELMPVTRLAAHAYNDAGFAHHKVKEWKRSAELFAMAVAADPTFALASYNLACAYARLNDPRTEAALRAAIKLDPGARERAKKDEDFAGLRTAPWFAPLTSPT